MHINDGRVVSNFMLGTTKFSITVYGSGAQTRSFCYVDDLVDGILKFMDQDEEIGPINIEQTKFPCMSWLRHLQAYGL